MDIGGIGSNAGHIGSTEAAGVGAPGGAQEDDAFAQMLADLSGSSAAADAAMNGLAVGGPQDLHDVVLSTQFESLSFELAVQVRNRLVEAYSEIFRMQV
ncbi:MAG: flagellar hook-basal body complex protein FliE [Dehalococcoidia bacterium]